VLVLVLVLVDSVFERIGGCLLVVSAFCGAMEILDRVRSRAGFEQRRPAG
jgi:hypothetical protein